MRSTAAVVALSGLCGCGTLVSSATSRLAGDLSTALLNQADVQTARDGLPAFLLLIDGLIEKMASCPAYWSLRFGLDQAALNCIVYDQRVAGVTLYSCLDGPIAHLALVPQTQLQFNDDGRLLGYDGRILPVLHQYDRHDCLKHLVAKAA